VQALHLLQNSLSYSARKSYRRSWELFCQYFTTYNIKVTMPLQIVQVCNFIGHLFWKQYSPSSIASHVSAISYVHKLLQLNDPTNSFIVRKLIKGCNNLSGTIDTRLPITMDILKNIMQGIEPAVQDFYLRIMLRAIFLLAFHALLRLGEIVAKSYADYGKILQREDISISYKDGHPTSLSFTLRHSKTIKNNQSVHISIESQSNLPQVCPVLAMDHYLKMCRPTQGPLFQFRSGSPVTQVCFYQFSKHPGIHWFEL